MVRRFGFYMGAALLISVAWPVTPSHAGFEFVAPINQEPVQKAPRQGDQKPILERSEVDPLLPLMSTQDKKVEVAPLSVLPTKMDIKPILPPDVIEKDTPPVAVSKKPMKAALSDASVVEGFANQIPLAIALQQVIPAQYQYAFADGVNAGEKVDWQGGKPWDQVVSNMVSDKGMDVEISGNVVYIRRQGMANTMPMAMPKPVAKVQKVEEKIPLLPSMTSRSVSTVRSEKGLLFDSPELAEFSGVARVMPENSMQSERLALDDLSIGQPMALVPSTQKKTTSIVEVPKKVVKNKKILTASSSNLSPAPVFDQKPVFNEKIKPENTIDVLPKTAPMSLAPVKDKKILLLDQMPKKSATKPLFPSEPINLGNAITPIEKLPNTGKVAMTDPMMSIMKKSMDTTIDMATPSIWQADSGETLRSVLEKWANESETSLIWESSYDYPLQADIEISGTFETAVRTLLDGLSDANPRPFGRLHRNAPAGQPVLVIETETLTN